MTRLPKITRALGLLGICLAGGSAMLVGQEADTMFGPPAPAAPRGAQGGDADLHALQLSGISTLGGQSMFNLVDTRNNRAFWITLNGTVNGISVVSYDAKTDTVVIARQGERRSVSLRQAQIASLPAQGQTQPHAAAAPASQPASGAAPAVIHTPDGGEIVNPKTPQEIAQAETEARMMVSDLLEISMQERARQKALREAKRQQQQQGGQAPPQ